MKRRNSKNSLKKSENNRNKNSGSNTEPKQERILVVDDDEALLEILQKGLSLHGYYCEATRSAASALELIEKDSFDIMITDIIMPDMNGLELTERVKRIRPEMTIVVITGHIEDFPYDRAIEVGASDFIKKPFTIKELLARIRYVKMQDELLMRERELKRRVQELEEFYDIAVGREMRMIELKKEIESLKKELSGNKTA
ncbi:MAG: response regulator [Thermodesulfovibrionales bacterium]|nr:response regulator [Thermodesulfovibrionales bacterium]